MLRTLRPVYNFICFAFTGLKVSIEQKQKPLEMILPVSIDLNKDVKWLFVFTRTTTRVLYRCVFIYTQIVKN